MKPQELFGDHAKARIKGTIAEVEAETSAELLVAARHASGDYRSADYLVGLVFLLIGLCLFLYYPEPFDFTYLPVELGAAFVLGVVSSASIPPIRRVFLSKKRMQDEVLRSARSAFFDLGVGRTSGRTGMLVFVSAFERTAVFVSDVGVPESAQLASARARVERVMRRGDLAGFLTALSEVGKELASLLPRGEGDLNELSDDVSEAQ